MRSSSIWKCSSRLPPGISPVSRRWPLPSGESQASFSRARLEKLSLTPEFRSKLEKRAWEQWVPTQSASVVKYEPLVFHLAGGNYTPDFMLAFDDGSLWFVEVKGNWKAYQSGRSSKHLLKQASVEFGFLGRWFALLPVPAKDGGGWHLEEYR